MSPGKGQGMTAPWVLSSNVWFKSYRVVLNTHFWKVEYLSLLFSTLTPFSQKFQDSGKNPVWVTFLFYDKIPWSKAASRRKSLFGLIVMEGEFIIARTGSAGITPSTANMKQKEQTRSGTRLCTLKVHPQWHFLQECYTSWTYPNSATNWGPNYSKTWAFGDISPSNYHKSHSML